MKTNNKRRRNNKHQMTLKDHLREAAYEALHEMAKRLWAIILALAMLIVPATHDAQDTAQDESASAPTCTCTCCEHTSETSLVQSDIARTLITSLTKNVSDVVVRAILGI